MTEQASAYPLQWPSGWPRTNATGRQSWPASPRPTVAGALRELGDELRRLGAKNIVLSSNVTLGNDRPDDPGVVAYATYEQQQIAIPCDRWNTVAGNLRAIAKTIEAMRGMERWGAKHMIRAMFQGFTAIRGPGPRPWREVLGLAEQAVVSPALVKQRMRELARVHHPDVGGSEAHMAEINAAASSALEDLARS